MKQAKQVALPNVSAAFLKAADVLLVLDDGTAILCHSQILSVHSSVISNMLADLNQHEGKVRIPLPEFTEAQCLALLEYLYSTGLASRGAAFETRGRAHLDAAGVVARFAHTYDAPHVLRHVEAYLATFMAPLGKMSEVEPGKPGLCTSGHFVDWAVMAEKFDMHDLRGHCERAMVISWHLFQNRPNLLDKLSCSALQRIARGLHKTLLASEKRHPDSALDYPAVQEVIAWGKHKEPAVQ